MSNSLMLGIRITYVCSLFLSVCFEANAQVEAFAVAPQADAYRQIVLQQVQQELGCLKLVADLTDDQSDTIIDNLDELVDEQSGEIANAIQGGNPYAMLGSSAAVIDAVTVEAKALLAPPVFKKYEADLALRSKFQRRAAQRGFLSAMDGYLQLSNKQQAALAKTLMAKWKDDWNSLAMVGAQGAGLFIIRDPLKTLPQDQLKAVLSESQWAAFDGILNLDQTVMVDQVGFAKLQGQAIGMLKLEEMTNLCSLSEAQSGKLKGAIDTVLAESVERKQAAMKAIQGGNFQQNMEQIIDLSRPIAQMMFANDNWTDTVDTVLSKEQSAKYAERTASREKRNKAAMTAAAAITLGAQTGGLTGKQQVALAKIYDKHLTESIGDPMGMSKQLLAIPEEEYQEILSDEQWGKMSQMLESMRRQFDGAGADAAVFVEEPIPAE